MLSLGHRPKGPAYPSPSMYTKIENYQVLQRDEDDKARVLHDGDPYTLGDVHNILVGDIWLVFHFPLDQIPQISSC